MNEKVSHLEGLARLARGDSDEGRQQLLHEVTDLFMQAPESLNEREVAYFGEIMGRIVVEVETMVRQHLSETICNVPNAPHDLICSLANDQIEVALPVLVSSEVLKDDDLIKVVNGDSQDHMRAISMRATVSEKVTDVLVKKGDDNVLETLAGNNGAAFSHNGMETMVARAKDNETLNKSLLGRKDVPDDMTHEMFWRVSWAMREQILGDDSKMDATQVDALMKETEQWFESQLATKKLDPAEKFIIRKEKMDQLDIGLLISLMRQEKVPEFVAGLSHMAKVDPTIARQAVFDPAGEKLSILCKALEMDYDIFGEILYLTNFDDSRDEDDTQALLGVYQRITPKVAQKALRFLRTRKTMEQRTT